MSALLLDSHPRVHIEDLLPQLETASEHLDWQPHDWRSALDIMLHVMAFVTDHGPGRRIQDWVSQVQEAGRYAEDCSNFDRAILDENEFLTLYFSLKSLGLLWNRLLQTGKALQCFSLAQDICRFLFACNVDSVEPEHEVDLHLCSFHTRGLDAAGADICYRPEAEEASVSTVAMPIPSVEIINQWDCLSRLGLKTLSSATSAAFCVKVQEYLLLLTREINKVFLPRHFEKVQGLLTRLDGKELLSQPTDDSDYTAKVLKAQRATFLAIMAADSWPFQWQQTNDQLLEAVHLWQDLRFPLECTTEILSLCTIYISKLFSKIQLAHQLKEMLETIGSLYSKIWCHMTHSKQVAHALNHLAAIAHRSNRFEEASCFQQEAIDLFQKQDQPLTFSMLRIRLVGIMKLGEVNPSALLEHLAQMAEFLDNMPNDTNWEAEAARLGRPIHLYTPVQHQRLLHQRPHNVSDSLRLRLLSETYKDLCQIVSKMPDVEESLKWWQKAFSFAQHCLKNEQDTWMPIHMHVMELCGQVGHCYHRKAVLLQSTDQSEEAEECFHLAKSTFIQGLQSKPSSPTWALQAMPARSSILFLWYGNLLLYLGQYEAAEQLFLNAKVTVGKQGINEMVTFYAHDETLPSDLLQELRRRDQTMLNLPIELAASYFGFLAKASSANNLELKASVRQGLIEFQSLVQKSELGSLSSSLMLDLVTHLNHLLLKDQEVAC